MRTKRTFTSSQMAIKMVESTTPMIALRLHRRRGRRNPDNCHQGEVNVREYSAASSKKRISSFIDGVSGG